jgi:DNA-binding response OmpR family regulator
MPAAPASSKLLIVDDEASVLKLVKTMLSRANYEVTTCGSASEALKLLSENPFDCVITDAVMPVMTGYDFVRAIRNDAALSGMPVLMLTRKRHRQDVKLAVEAGVTDYVLKPIDEYLLLDKVEMCLKKTGMKRQIYEHQINGDHANAQVGIDCRVISICESDVTIRLPFALEERMPFHLWSNIFEEVGIAVPLLKLYKCDKIEDGNKDLADFPYEVKLSFVGVADTDLKKVRAWLQRQDVARRQ